MISANEDELKKWATSLQDLRLLKNVITRDIIRFQDQTRNLSNWNDWINYVYVPEPEEKKEKSKETPKTKVPRDDFGINFTE
jgi:hypothetical protein